MSENYAHTLCSESGFRLAIDDSRAEAARKQEARLATFLQVQGIPEQHDLGAVLAVKEMFGVSSEAFDRIIKAARSKQEE
jgi:hypothetical protein